MAVEERKKDIAKDYIKENILLKKELDAAQGSILSEINNIRNEINSIKNFDILGSDDTGEDNENTGLEDDNILGLNSVMGILFNNQGNQRRESGYELKKSANIFLTEEDKKSLDLLYESLKKAKTEEELKKYLGKELDDLHSDVESNTNSNETSTEESKTDSNTEGNTDSNQNTDISSEIDNASVEEIAHLGSNRSTRKEGEKLEVDKEKRKNFLFPQGLPESKQEMVSKYLKEITVPILDKKGNEKNLKLKIHSKLANNYIAVFKELKEEKIKINSSSTAAFVWRKVRRGQRMSDHSYGTAIDVNRSDNGGVYGPTNKNSEFFNSQKTVEIFKKYGFARGGDRSAESDDPMHFTYMGG